jgi:hypothetical protein
MQIRATNFESLRLAFHFLVSTAVIALALMLLIYPAITICVVVMDPHLAKTGESRLVPLWFKSAAGRFVSWANMYLDTNYAKSLHHDDIPATEWPMFGSVFFLVTAEDLQERGAIDATQGTIREAVEKAAQIVASLVTATWVKTKWGNAYEKNFWKDTGWVAGFSEMPRGSQADFMDVDSGPVLFDVGSVASAFAIGAAKSVGRIDHAAPLAAEVVAASWPTPFGPLIPGFMGRVAVKSWSLGEVALLFSMTRPTLAAETVPFEGHTPWIVWALFLVYAGAGSFLIWFEIRSCRRLIRIIHGSTPSAKRERGQLVSQASLTLRAWYGAPYAATAASVNNPGQSGRTHTITRRTRPCDVG